MFRTAALIVSLALVAAPAEARKVPVPRERDSDEIARLYFTEDPDAPRHAPPGYDVTIVEYMDYQCPACGQANAALRQLMAEDKKVRIIFRDIPVFGPASEKAARVAVAAKYQNKYLAVHQALLHSPRPLNDRKIEAAVRRAGADWELLQADLKRHSQDIEDLIERNMIQADMLRMRGTPGFIIGSSLVYGTVSLDNIRKLIREARAKRVGAGR